MSEKTGRASRPVGPLVSPHISRPGEHRPGEASRCFLRSALSAAAWGNPGTRRAFRRAGRLQRKATLTTFLPGASSAGKSPFRNRASTSRPARAVSTTRTTAAVSGLSRRIVRFPYTGEQ